jgi:hypothetical protein
MMTREQQQRVAHLRMRDSREVEDGELVPDVSEYGTRLDADTFRVGDEWVARVLLANEQPGESMLVLDAAMTREGVEFRVWIDGDGEPLATWKFEYAPLLDAMLGDHA